MRPTKIYCCECEGSGFHDWPVMAKCETCGGKGIVPLIYGQTPDPVIKAAICFAAAVAGVAFLLWRLGWPG